MAKDHGEESPLELRCRGQLLPADVSPEVWLGFAEVLRSRLWAKVLDFYTDLI